MRLVAGLVMNREAPITAPGALGERLPTIYVREHRLPFVAGLATMIAGLALLYFRWPPTHENRLSIGAAFVVTVLGLIPVVRFFRHKPKIVIRPQGFELIARRTGLIRWHEIVHIESFHVPESNSSAVAIFLTAEATARLPRGAKDDQTLVFAGAAPELPQHHLWFNDALLEYSARDIARELEARRHGASGPLTAKVLKKG